MTVFKSFSVRLPKEVYEKLEDVAWKNRKFKTDVILEALLHYFKHLHKNGKA